MRCPSCGHDEDRVLDTRPVREGAAIRRRRECLACQHRFTTYEYVEAGTFQVVKKDGRREPFQREKLIHGLAKACEKRPISATVIEETGRSDRGGPGAHRQVGGQEHGRRRSRAGERCATLDPVAYVRFASVYLNFSDIRQFLETIQELPARHERRADDAPSRADPTPRRVQREVVLQEDRRWVPQDPRGRGRGDPAGPQQHKEIDPELYDDLEAVLLRGDVGPATTAELIARLKQKVQDERIEEPGRPARGPARRSSRRSSAGRRRRRPRRVRARSPASRGSSSSSGSTGWARRPPWPSWPIRAQGGGADPGHRRLRHLPGRGQRAARGLGQAARRADRAQPDRGRSRARWPSTGSGRPRRAAPTSSWSTPPGRLQTKGNLMEELKKIHRVCGKALPGAPHETILVLDATIGQNAISQARLFSEAVPDRRHPPGQARRHEQGRRHPRHRPRAARSRSAMPAWGRRPRIWSTSIPALFADGLVGRVRPKTRN